MANDVNVFVKEFYTTYVDAVRTKLDENGQPIPFPNPRPGDPRYLEEAYTKPVDMVVLIPAHHPKEEIPHRIVDVKRNAPMWEKIGPAYENWKQGLETPLSGTPLAAWNGISHREAELLKSFMIRTVEDVAAMSDMALTQVPIPRMRDLRSQAQIWLKAQDSNMVRAELSRRDNEIEALKAQIESLALAIANKSTPAETYEWTPSEQLDDPLTTKAKMDEMRADYLNAQGRDKDPQPVKRKPGRPRKVAVEGDEAAA